MISITRLLLGLDTTPGSGYLCAVSDGEAGRARRGRAVCGRPRSGPPLALDENHGGGPVDSHIRPALPEALLLQCRDSHRHLQDPVPRLLDLGGSGQGLRRTRSRPSSPQAACVTRAAAMFHSGHPGLCCPASLGSGSCALHTWLGGWDPQVGPGSSRMRGPVLPARATGGSLPHGSPVLEGLRRDLGLRRGRSHPQAPRLPLVSFAAPRPQSPGEWPCGPPIKLC